MGSTITSNEHVATGMPVDTRTFELALLAGLAGVFIVNALVAYLQPNDFVDLVRSSVLADRMPVQPGRWLAWAICVNDLALGLLLVASIRIRRWKSAMLAWSGRVAARGHGHQGDVTRRRRRVRRTIPERFVPSPSVSPWDAPRQTLAGTKHSDVSS